MKIQLQSFLRFFRHQKIHNSAHLSSDAITSVIARMNELMEIQQPFLQSGYDIKSLAYELKIPSYQLSAILNRQMGTNFNNYINQFRVTYFKDLVKQGMAENLNLKGLSEKCGFNNRNSFTAAFKKFTGKNPSEYLRQHIQYQFP